MGRARELIQCVGVCTLGQSPFDESARKFKKRGGRKRKRTGVGLVWNETAAESLSPES